MEMGKAQLGNICILEKYVVNPVADFLAMVAERGLLSHPYRFLDLGMVEGQIDHILSTNCVYLILLVCLLKTNGGR